MVPVLFGSAPLCAISFYGYHIGQTYFKSRNKDISKKLDYVEHGMAGSFAGGLTCLLVSPLERVKIILQTTRSTMNEVLVLIKTQSITRFFRGSGLTLFRDGVGNFIYFSTYEIMMDTVPFKRSHPITILTSGGLNFISY